MSSTTVDDPTFQAGMADTVKALRGLCTAITDAGARHGHQPSANSRAMWDVATQASQKYETRSEWPTPLQDTQTFAGMTLLAASDYGHCYASLFTGDRAPVFGHLGMARGVLEASVVTAWLSEPGIETIDRIKRGLCEQMYSTSELDRLKIPDNGANADRVERWKRVADAFGWGVAWNRTKPVIDGESRPNIPDGIDALVLDESKGTLGRVQWSYLSSVLHVTWYGLRQAIIEDPPDNPLLGPSLAGVGTESKSVNSQSLCLLLALRRAATKRMIYMGWVDDEWQEACRQSAAHELALLKWLAENP